MKTFYQLVVIYTNTKNLKEKGTRKLKREENVGLRDL